MSVRTISQKMTSTNKGSSTATDTPSEFKKKRLKKGSVPSCNLKRREKDERTASRRTVTAQKARSELSSSLEEWDTNEDLEVFDCFENSFDPFPLMLDPATELEAIKKQFAAAKEEIPKLRARIFSYDSLSKEEVKNYTGLDQSAFNIMVQMIERFQPLRYWSGKTVNSISSSDQLLMFLMKVKLDLPYFDLARRYAVSKTTIQNIFLTYLHVVHEIFFVGCLDQLPSLE